MLSIVKSYLPVCKGNKHAFDLLGPLHLHLFHAKYLAWKVDRIVLLSFYKESVDLVIHSSNRNALVAKDHSNWLALNVEGDV